MAFDSLPETVQNLMIEEYFSFSKNFWIFLIISFALIYLLYWRKYIEKPTPYFSVGILRILLSSFCIINLIASPLFILFIHPQFYFWNFFNIFFGFYSVIIIIYMLVLVIDVIYFAPTVILRLGGFDLKDRKVNEVFRRFFKRQVFMK